MEDNEDPIDKAINWEFQLWKAAEQSRFQAELKKIESQRMNLLKKQYQEALDQLEDQKFQRSSQIDKLQLQIQQSISQTQEKIQQQQSLQSSVKNQISNIKNNLKQTLLQADHQLQIMLTEAETMLQAESAKSEQFSAQAAFFQQEIQNVEQKRKTEVIDFQKFLKDQNNVRILQNQILEISENLESKRQTDLELNQQIQIFEIQLQKIINEINQLKMM
ncbi:hypothetical protein SS50377_22265 [Spironucleus salmonicida]|uniref:Uncharacterized protein n=1 Tax=Spironucleus salmonicida TaxID=348837 RepID=V6LEY9_9EUKA|nr:hypothetical protein SS50377_22265 [Spironucleus salmonicida]|eukprot:EST42241.1 hypothetical protein SS50377_18543 [Spironucleus salmonicida]